MSTKVKEKKQFKMPHLLFLMLILLMVMSILTYILPAGEFVETADGGKEYVSVERSPVNPIQAMLYIFDGISGSGAIIALLLVIGGCVAVSLGTKSLDSVIDYCLYKLQDKGTVVLIPVMFILMAMLGAFGGSDALIAVIPIGVMFAKKLKLDPICGAAVSFLGTMVGFSTSPVGVFVAQSLMGVTPYSGFGFRFLNLMLCAVIGATYVTIYAKRVEKDPTRSAMGSLEWQAELGETGSLEEKKLDIRDVIVTILFFGQFLLAILLNMKLGMGYGAFPLAMITCSILMGLIKGMKFDEIGNKFAEGVNGMGFICFIIGLASAISVIMRNGKILDTIAYYASLPLQNLGSGLASIGISIVVTLLNFFVPSATAKAAALIPIIKPMAENLGVSLQLATQAFQVGDGFCNIVSPFLAWTIGGLAIAKVPYQKWLKWVLPLLGIFLAVEWVLLVILANIGWA